MSLLINWSENDQKETGKTGNKGRGLVYLHLSDHEPDAKQRYDISINL